MKVAVLGAAGMLGTDLVRVLAEEGHSVCAATREQADLTDPGSVKNWLEQAAPEVVVNAAAYTNVDGAESDEALAHAVNDVAVRDLAGICRDLDLRAVHVSTDYVFCGAELGRPWQEQDPVEAHGVYGRSKLQGELAFREVLGEDGGLVVRTQWLFGHGGRNFVEAILRQLRPGAELRVVDDQRGRPTWTQDLARGIAWLIGVDARGVVHVANEGEATWLEFAERIVAASGATEVTLHPQRTVDAGRPAPRPHYSVLDLDRFATRTGRRLPTWSEALDAYLEGRGSET